MKLQSQKAASSRTPEGLIEISPSPLLSVNDNHSAMGEPVNENVKVIIAKVKENIVDPFHLVSKERESSPEVTRIQPMVDEPGEEEERFVDTVSQAVSVVPTPLSEAKTPSIKVEPVAVQGPP